MCPGRLGRRVQYTMHIYAMPRAEPRWVVVLRWVGEVWCGFAGGHDWVTVREPLTICLQCSHCGRRTSGFSLRGTNGPATQ